MPNDVSKQSPMIAKAGAGDDAAGSAAEQAQAMRAKLGVQRENEKLTAEASELKRAAADEADTIVAAAEALATQLVDEARQTAEALASEAHERADGIVARARFEADDLQQHTEEMRARIQDEALAASRAEIEEFRSRTAGLVDDAESGLRQLAPDLEGAVATVVEVLRSLEELRTGRTVDTKPAALGRSGGPELHSVQDHTTADTEAMVAEGAPPTSAEDPDARPLGWLFRASEG
jgi:cell division septum initiation protein DivIVA